MTTAKKNPNRVPKPAAKLEPVSRAELPFAKEHDFDRFLNELWAALSVEEKLDAINVVYE